MQGRTGRNRAEERELTPGEIYRAIPATRKEFEREEIMLSRKAVPPFVRFCRRINRAVPSLGKGGKFNKENQEAVEFLGWDLNAGEFCAAGKFVLISTLLAGFAIALAVYLSPLKGIVDSIAGGMQFMTPVYIFCPLIILSLYLTNYVQTYPIKAARVEQVRALTYVPEILGYMVMSMKLVPNLEKAIEFAAKHGRGKIAEDLRKLIWEVEIGVYTTLSEALDTLAYRWGNFSDEFKHALMMVRASVIENTEAKRYAILDKTMADVLESIKEKMEQYARDLSQPSIMLFYVGVLLPLILIIILPVGSSFSGAPLANPVVLGLAYLVIIPLVTIIFARNLVMRRPPTYEPPDIPDSFPGLPPKGTMRFGRGLLNIKLVVIAVIICGLVVSVFVHFEGLPPKSLMKEGAPQFLRYDLTREEILESESKPQNYFSIGNGVRYREFLAQGYIPAKAEEAARLEETLYFMQAEHDDTPYNLIFGTLITLSLAAFVYLHYSNSEKRKVQLEVMVMETEFKDSLYVLASRMGENKPVEEALKHTCSFLPNFKISEKVFGKTVDNITLLAMPLEAAVFDPVYGSLKDNPSSVIRGSMRLLVDSVQLGVNVAARTMISLSMQLGNSQKVANNLRVLVSDTTGMMRTMTVFIAPIVLGLTTSLQRIVVITLSSIASSGAMETPAATNLSEYAIKGMPSFTQFNVSSFIKTDAMLSMATPAQFTIIVALYIVELVIIMSYFTTRIEEDNSLLVKMNIAYALPVAMVIFVVSMIVSSALVGGFMGG